MACAAAAPLESVQSDTARGCPLGVRGVQVETQDSPDGIDIVFTTHNHVDDLRLRVRDAAAMHGSGAHKGPGHDGDHGRGQSHGLQLVALPAVTARADDIPSGAKLHLATVDPAEVGTVRLRVRQRLETLAEQDCE